MRWQKKEADSQAVKRLCERLKIDALTAAILIRRGITEADKILYFLEDDPRYLHNPFLFNKMEDAVDRILLAIDEGESVLVFGDRDSDGVTGTILLTTALRAMGANLEWSLPVGEEAYGLSTRVIDEAAANGCTLIITVDCGISNHQEVIYAREKFIDVIVIDHHLLKADAVPEAVAVVNPKLDDCGYPFRELSACAVAYKLVTALKFAQAPFDFYKQDIALLNVVPLNESYLIEAVKICNMVEIDRVRETIVPGSVTIEQTRLLKFLQGRQIFVWDASAQNRLLRKAFPSVDFNFGDSAPMVAQMIPATNGLSLLRLKEISSIAKYSSNELSEIDVFVNLFISYMQRVTKIYDDDGNIAQLATLSTISDIMPLEGENRILVKRGLSFINSKPCAGLRELLERKEQLGKKFTATDLSWQIIPILNAAGRMGQATTAVKCFLADAPTERMELATKMLSLNDERRSMGTESWDLIYPLAQKSLEEHSGNMVLVGGEKIPRGITGIIASKVNAVLNVPAVIVAFLADGTVHGSIRAIRGFDTNSFLENGRDLFIDFGGHDAAAGFSLHQKDWKKFTERCVLYARGIELKDEEKVIDVDAELPHDFINEELPKVVARLEPFGNAFPGLTFLAKNVRVAQADLIGKGAEHFKFLLDFGKTKWPSLFWNVGNNPSYSFKVDEKIDLVFRVSMNYFAGTEKPQIEIIDAKIAG